jgi:ABC-2 type transport system ATP-binding protein
MTEPAILIRDLRKNYGRVQALRGVDLEVQQGEIFGFLGPNGAGKTTTIRCLLDLIRPNGGEIRVLGLDPQRHSVQVRARAGYLPGELSPDGSLTGLEFLRYCNRIRGNRAKEELIHRLAERLQVDLSLAIRNLSHGNKQKIALIQALMHQPELLILDEPTTGLDPLVQRELLAMLREACQGGTTVFFSSHVISVVEKIAHRVGIIRQGKVIEVAETGDLLRRALRRVHVRFRQPVDPAEFARLQGVELLDGSDAHSLYFQVKGDMAPLVRKIADKPVIEIETERPSLEEIFITYYAGQQEGEP